MQHPTDAVFAQHSRRGRSVTAELKDYILSHELRPGDPFPPESTLVEQLDVSRSSLREAIRTLVALDIIEVRHGYGTIVGKMSMAPLVEGLAFKAVMNASGDMSALREVVEIRQALDLAMARDVVAALDGTEDSELAELVGAMQEKARRGRTFADEDGAFHSRLLARVGNSLAGQLISALWEVHTIVTPRLGIAPPDDIADTAAAHGEMLRCAQAGDLDGYRSAVVAHYAPLRRVLDALED
ncbi:FadR/GntR family transcriptional regulator [Spelaeicoccus albus]|uniref:DNA-binding FadR family transcriptional regulator n=1 Tax=Spelaeicoccus albus TaxID=1280376 RepID=A0A7Z0D276_9MICO|nr:FCD domain-containing protein [Spelaeicoccus albus]NYI67509.1 DNA-binding FadR family transcriptional regulator [Spelaeicoccus albus]